MAASDTRAASRMKDSSAGLLIRRCSSTTPVMSIHVAFEQMLFKSFG